MKQTANPETQRVRERSEAAKTTDVQTIRKQENPVRARQRTQSARRDRGKDAISDAHARTTPPITPQQRQHGSERIETRDTRSSYDDP